MYMTEITELFVKREYRQRGIATAMIAFAEDYRKKQYSSYLFELLTGENNKIAQTFYHKIGYEADGEIHLIKGIEC